MSKSENDPKPKKLRNPEGEAQAQWREEDLDFGGKKKQMIGSDGQIISLDDQQSEEKPAAGMLKAVINGTEQQESKVLMNLLTSEVTFYKFTLSFGNKSKWEIKKRYSDFDRLDNRLNDKYGLPPIGLPPKKWFGLSDPELIDMRHKMLSAYINDCLKRPTLIHSRELQIFVEMPEDVVSVVTKGR